MNTTTENIIDVANEVRREVLCQSNVLFAQQRRDNVLILSKLSNLVKRFDGKRATYVLEHRWLSNPDSVHSVSGNDFTYWTTKETKPILEAIEAGKSLFDCFDLF